MSTHTPGPWKWVGTTAKPKLAAYLQNADFDQVGVALDGFTENKANARLIESAPCLLAALECIANWSEAEGSPFALSAAKTARAAIAKATQP